MNTIRHNVRMVRQRTSPICWLACATMIIQYKRGFTPDSTYLGQNGGDFRFQSVPREPHADSGAQEISELQRLGFNVTTSAIAARNLAQFPTMGPNRAGRTAIPPGGPSEELVHWILETHGPFILRHNAGAFSYGPNRAPVTSGLGHSVVVTGINPSRNMVYFNNPWGDRDVPTSVSSIVGAMQRWERRGGRSIAWL